MQLRAMEDRLSTGRATTTQHSNQAQAAISRLPPELLTQILNHLNFPGLSTFLDSCHLFRQFPSDSFIHNTREAYINDLLTKEQSDAGYREVCAQNLVRYCMTPPINDIHQNRALKADALVCYTCYSELPRERFLRNQITGNRSYGHVQARRRFCIDCGIKHRKWVPGTTFNRFNGSLIVCISCRGLKATSSEARASKLCNECHEQRVEDQFMLRRLSYLTETSSAERSDDEDQRSENDSEVSVFSSESSVDLGAMDERDVICRRCWIVDHTVTKILVVEGRPERSLCEECVRSK